MTIELAFEALGSGPPVVILHGLFGAGRNWMQIAESLAASYRVYLPDARNHGASPWASGMSYCDMALDIKALIEREQMEPPFLIGHSMGGKTAMALALGHPEAVSGIAVIDIAPECYAGQFEAYVAAMRGLDLASANDRRQIRDALADKLNRGASVDFLLQNLRHRKERFDWRMNLLATTARMRELSSFPEPLLREHYDGPALFIAGRESDYVNADSHARIRKLFPCVQMESIADAGHWVHADQPEALLCGLHDWLSEASAFAPR